VKEWFGALARVVVGGVWLAAGLLKVSDGAASVRAVRAYDLLPEAVVPTIGHALPALEIVIGLALVAGALTRPAAVVSALLFLAFIFGISSAWSRGLQIDCGCFGGGGFDAKATDKYPWEIARDAGLLLLSLWLVRWPRTRLSLDSYIFRPLIPADTAALPGDDRESEHVEPPTHHR
jgi:uncharacterized membrane protein YphA (DoxX/SURF4 family)